MKKILLLILILLSMVICFGQHNTQLTNQPKNEKYIIGIGNNDFNMYLAIVNYLQHNPNVSVYAICEIHQIIGINSIYKSYDILRDDIINEYPEILLFKKNETVFTNECKDDIIKQ